MQKVPRVLVVDDQPTNRKLLRTMLEADGYEVSMAESGEQCLAMVRAVRPDAILLDVMMPDLSGIDATRILKSNAETADVPVIIVTSLQDKSTRHQALEVGAEDFLCRPVDSHELRSRLRNLVRLKLLHDEVRRTNSRLEEKVSAQTDKLAASEEFLRASLDAMTALVVIVNAEMKIVAVNARWRDYLSRDGKAASDAGVGQAYSPEMLFVDQHASSRFLAGVEKVRRREILTHAQELQSEQMNWETWFLTQATSFGDGSDGHIVITHQDITLQKLAESDLEDREYEWRTLAETTPAAILRLTADGRVHFSNRDFSDLGLATQTSIYEKMHEEDREDFRAVMARCLNGRQKSLVRVRIQSASKQYRYWQFSLAPVSYRTHELFVIAVGDDVTDRVYAEEELRESKNRLEVLASASSEALLFVSDSGSIIDANEQAAEMLECDLGVLRSQTLRDIVGTGVSEELLKASQRVARLYDLKIELSSGASLAVDISLTRLREVGDLSGHSHQALSVVAVRDISSRKSAEEKVRTLQTQLQQSQKMEALGQLAGGVAHDFNNLLTSIISFSGFVRDELPEGSTAREDIDEVLAAADRATGLTRQLLIFSRQRPSELQSVNIAEALRSIEKLLGRTIGEDVDLVLSVSEGEMLVLADPTQFDQIILNLVVNARDAMPSGGTIRIEASNVVVDEKNEPASPAPGAYVLIRVSDTGTGIQPDTIERIFEPFFTTKESNKGTGLGLATCYGVVKQLGGTIDVQSKVGKGTTFRIYLPLDQAVRKTRARPRKISHVLSGHETVLLVEDEETIRRLAERALKDKGYRVLVATDAKEALKTFEANQMTIDIVFSDVILPNGNGFDIATEIRRRNPALPILLTSGYSGDRIPEEKQADFPILWKPYGSHDLVQRLRTCLDERKFR